jgi:subtilisin family serine protease
MTCIRGRLRLSILLLTLFTSMTASGSAKLDANLLQAAAEQQRINALKPAERIQAAAAVPDLEVLIRFQGDGVAKIRAAGGVVRSVLGNIASVTLPASALGAVTALPEVIYLEVPPPPVKRLNVSVPATRASQLRSGTAPNWTGNVGTGAGVIVGIIDDGIAFRHQDFRNPDGTTRIIELWDQRTTGAAGAPPAGYTAGGVCTSAMINAAIGGNAAACTQPSTGNHGTHVGGIAAGNGQATGNGQAAYRFVGMAPNADILAANSIGAGVSGSELVNAVAWMKDRAAALGKPLVINLSLGSYFGARDGTSNFETALTNASGAGVVITGAAGNEGGDKIRAVGTLSQGEIKTVNFDWRTGLTGRQRMEMWYPGTHVYAVKVTGPGANCGTDVFVSPGTPQTFTLACGELVVTSTDSQALNDDRQILVNFNPSVGNPTGFVGAWTIAIRGDTVTAANTPFSIICGEDSSGLLFTSNTEAVTRAILTNASTANRVIAVGAYNTNYNWLTTGGAANNPPNTGLVNDVGNFSSRGPRRDCSNLTKCPRVMKPSITAPGAFIMSSLGADAPNPGNDTVEQDGVRVAYNGTSMATPHVTGAIALMLQKNPALTPEQALRLLAITRQTNAFTTNLPTYNEAAPLVPAVENDHWGYGIMDAKAAVDAITQTITGFNPTTPVTVGATPATLTASGGLSGSPIVFGTTSANTVCTVAGNTVTFVGAGTCALTANQAAGGGALAAAQVTANIVINASGLPPTVVTFAAQTPAFQPLIIGGTFPINPMAVAGASSAAVTYTATPTGVCSIVGNTTTVTMAGIGDCAITANQAGDATHSPATPVTQTVAIVATLDVDRAQSATQYHATTDGMLVMRYLLGLQGAALTAGALGDSPARGDPVAVRAYLDAIRSKLDIDGDTVFEAATDGVLILRYLLGFRGPALVNGAVATSPRTPIRTSATDIEIYIRSLLR